ncbi:hypothetical protein ACFZBE_40580 [Streptomyces sp. NPDC008061]|uniref:hypothetical protein n=1 Tax=Streptomyces sp. NPDC008061 TaxID=3364805 RepID=UPI0036E4F6E2
MAEVRDGMDLGLGAPVPREPEPEGRTAVRVVSGPGAGTIFRLVPGDYDIGSAPGCRIRLAQGAPLLAARVRVGLAESAELLMTDTALLDGKPASDRSLWREGSQLAVGDTLLELTSRQTARASLTPAEDGLGLEINRPPRFLPPAAGAKFRLPTPPVKPDKRPIPLLPAGSAAIAIFVTHRWSFVFIALLSPIAALVTQFGGRKQAMLKYPEKKEEYEQALAGIRADIDAAVLEEQHNLRLSLPDPAAMLQMASQPSERLWERRWRDPAFLSVRVGTTDLPSSISVDDPEQDEHRRNTVPWLNQVPVAVPLRKAGVAGVAGPEATRLAGWLAAQAAALHSSTDLRIVVLAGPAGARDWSWTRWLPHTQAQGEDAYALVGSTADSLARRVGELGQLGASRIAAGPDVTRGGANGYPDVLIILEQARRARSLPG